MFQRCCLRSFLTFYRLLCLYQVQFFLQLCYDFFLNLQYNANSNFLIIGVQHNRSVQEQINYVCFNISYSPYMVTLHFDNSAFFQTKYRSKNFHVRVILNYSVNCSVMIGSHICRYGILSLLSVASWDTVFLSNICLTVTDISLLFFNSGKPLLIYCVNIYNYYIHFYLIIKLTIISNVIRCIFERPNSNS